MLVSVTPLGVRGADSAAAAIQVVNYVESKVQAAHRLANDSSDGVRAYYADSVEGPGRWVGEGSSALGLHGRVAAEHLERVLVGTHPGTRETLRKAANTTRRGPADLHAEGTAADVLTLPEAARLAGMNVRTLRRIAERTEREFALRGDDTDAGPHAPSKTFLVATRTEQGTWQVQRSELERFMAARRPIKTVIGYDVTFSAPKSVSILWAVADPRTQREIVCAVEAAVDAGLSYLESVTGTRAPSRPALRGLVAAGFLHGTSRNLDPQLHVHAIVANLALRLDGEVRALDGRDLFAHAKTAGYLAAAHLRHECAQRFGWRWSPVIHGLADVEGVPAEAIRAMSSRHDEIETLATEMGVHSASAKQVAAYRTRTAKQAVAPEELRAEWGQRLTDAGFDAATREKAFAHRVEPAPLTDVDRGALLAHLASAQGVTERSAVFDRRDVIQAAASWSGARLSASDILEITDAFLASETAIPLAPATNNEVIRLRGGRVAPAARGLTRYSTPAMLHAERQVLDAFAAGLDRGLGVVPADVIETAIAARPSLGTDQAVMVRAICSSGDQFQCVLGPAGSGKTFALDAARDAWQRAGYRVFGAADQGTAAEVLGRGTGIRAETLEYWLTVLDTHADPGSVFDARTVLLVDEASTAGTRSLARLFTHARRSGAIVRLVGDPAQHSAVSAGGAFRDLIHMYEQRTPELTELRRQAGPELAQLRLALHEYRDGLIAQSIDRLQADDRVVLADTAEELLDQLATDWWVDRERRDVDPSRASSSMVAEHHRERRALNTRARIMLGAAGDLRGPTLQAGAHEFRTGDEVICRAPAKHLHPDGQPRRYLRNGTRGTVIAVHPDGQPAITVDFEHRGPIRVPIEFLTRELRPGVHGGLTYSYALTTHAAQGHTHDAARTLATDGSTRPGIYVGLTRGQHDSRLYAVRRRDLDTDREAEDHLPRLEDDKSALEAVTDRLITTGHEQLATTQDPTAREVAALRGAHRLADLVSVYQSVQDTDQRAIVARAVRARRDVLARQARLKPPPQLVARIGPRPARGPDRRVWDAAVGATAVHHELRDAPAGAARELGLPDAAGVAGRVREAEISYLARQPTRDLANEVGSLTAELTTGGRASLLRRGNLSAALERADQAIDHARHRLAELRAQHGQSAGSTAATSTRIAHEHAEIEVARADWHHDQLAHRLALLDEDPAAHDRVAQRLERLRAALDRQVRIAVEHALTRPPAYVTTLIGPRPGGEAGQHWDGRVRQLEQYRHHHGLSPNDLTTEPQFGPVEQALGPRPTAPAAALAWQTTLDALTAAAPALEPTG